MFALVDGNAFYCSCERVFQPRLADQPVVVLSNNDGCIVSCTAEAKARGLTLGEVWHLACPERRAGVHAFSSNYPLYGDMSRRVMATLRDAAPRLEVYSIDEAFLGFDDRTAWAPLGAGIRATVRRHTGIPVSVGFGPTKVLAKLANRLAKPPATADGVYVWPEEPAAAAATLAAVPVEKVWGIGQRLAARLAAQGVTTALALRDLDDATARRLLSVVGLRLVWELRGVSCLELADLAPAKQSLCCAKGFGRLLTTREQLQEPLSCYVSTLAAKLRAQRLTAGYLQIFLETDRHGGGPQYGPGAGAALPRPTNDTPTLARAAADLLRRLYRPGYAYRKVGVLVADLGAEAAVQLTLADPAPAEEARRQTLMRTVDRLNQTLGRGTVRLGSAGPAVPAWRMRQAHLSPGYTTRWDSLLTVRA